MSGWEVALVESLRKLRREQTQHWDEYNAVLPRVLPQALGLLHARAAADDDFARRLVFDEFHLEGAGAKRDDPHDRIMDEVRTCLLVFSDDMTDPLSDEDWEQIEALARV